MTYRFRDIDNNVEAEFSLQNDDYFPKFLPTQPRHSKLSDILWFKKL